MTSIIEKSAIILAGGFSRRLGKDKGLIKLTGKPLVLHVADAVSKVTEEVVVVVGSEKQERDYSQILRSSAIVIRDKYDVQSPLVGALTGFESARGGYSLLLPCDAPFISTKVLSFLFKLCRNVDAVIPRWPCGHLEPLQACYRTRTSETAARTALKEGKLDMRSLINHLEKVTYLSTSILKQIDPELMTFFNVNTHEDLKKAEIMLKRASAKH
ncbi:molybdenum cofactor guanylyltransferase [Candidatus Bathyarchaeota archaeon]|nr:molybdenum cofactor guanylyltransferase [Candidatus Bathyarchaeota archaeon]